MLINDVLVLKPKNLQDEALWYQETAFEEGKILLGKFFQENEEEEKKVVSNTS